MLMLQWECGQQETVSALTFKHIQAGSEMYTHFQSILPSQSSEQHIKCAEAKASRAHHEAVYMSAEVMPA